MSDIVDCEDDDDDDDDDYTQQSLKHILKQLGTPRKEKLLLAQYSHELPNKICPSFSRFKTSKFAFIQKISCKFAIRYLTKLNKITESK
jgi:hypothetical protein